MKPTSPTARLLSTSALLLGGLAVACSAPPADDEGDSGGAGALSEADCRPKAEKAEDGEHTACTERNKFDYAACKKPAETTYEQYQARLNAAYANIKSTVDAITGACKALVADKSCTQILSDAGDDFAAAKGDPALCKTARSDRQNQCDVQARNELEQELGSDAAYLKLLDEQDTRWAAFKASVGVCWISKVSKASANATCGVQAKAKYQSAYLSCRRECPEIAAAACTPEDYEGEVVPCGAYEKVTSKLGLFCESDRQCKRTSVCDKYDTAKKDADRLNKSSGCTTGDKTGVLIPEVTTEKRGDIELAKGVTTKCVAP